MAESDVAAELAHLRARVADLERQDPAASLLLPILAVAPVILVRFDHLNRIKYVSRYVPGLRAEEVVQALKPDYNAQWREGGHEYGRAEAGVQEDDA